MRNSQNEVNNNGAEQSNSQNRGSNSVVESTLSSHTDTSGSPVEREESVYHRSHSNQREQAGGDSSDVVTEIEETDGQTA